MIPVGNAKQSREIDRYAEVAGTPSILLMENAAFSLYLEAIKIISIFMPEKIVLFAGKGGNGGDGFALLRIMRDRGIKIPMQILPLFKPDELQGDSKTNYSILPENVEFISSLSVITGRVLFVDGMIGTGLTKNLSADILDCVKFINSYSNKKVLAIDIPTGLNSDTGKLMPEAVISDVTVSMAILKTGLFAGDGPRCSGKIVQGMISAPEKALDNLETGMIEETDFNLPEIAIDAHKNKNGHALFIGGDTTKIGAIFIAAQSFLASGGGLATVALESEQLLNFAGRFPGIMLTGINSISDNKDKYHAVIAGPGLSDISDNLKNFLINFNGAMVLDAGMFDAFLADTKFFLALKTKKVVFTPHPGELKRFLSSEKDWQSLVHEFPISESQILYAKNSTSFIKHGNNTFILPHGAKALSFGGTGDALTGILAAMLVKPVTMREAVINAALIHRTAGLLLEEKHGAETHIIEFLIKSISEAIKYLRKRP